VAGDSLEWSETLTDYPADEYTLSYIFVSAFGKFEATVTPDGTDYTVTIPGTDTSGLSAAQYEWQKKVTEIATSKVNTIARGRTRVQVDYASVQDGEAYDFRSWAEQTLENIEAVLKGKASRDQSSWSVGSRSLSRYSFAELREMQLDLRDEVRRQRSAEASKRGARTRRTVFARMNSA
jgi:hypothetical protein